MQECVIENHFLYFLNYICVVSNKKNHLNETVLMSTQNIS